MREVEEHRTATSAMVGALAPQRVALLRARGLVLAEHIDSRLSVPPFDNSAMDGYAVIAGDVEAASEQSPVELRVIEDIPAGYWPEKTVGRGQASRIMTGAPMPGGADAVLIVENTDQGAGPGGDLPEVVRAYAPAGAHVRRAGEDTRPGERVLHAGTILGPAQLSAAASTGHASLLVVPAPRIAVISTGSELAAPGEELAPGQIPDSNSTLLAALAQEAGGVVTRVENCGDSARALRETIARVSGQADLIVTSGGVSAGAYDVVKAAFDGELEFVKVAMQPGKPQGYGTVEGTPVFALPGNPVSVFVSFHLFVAPAIRIMRGLDPEEAAPDLMPATAACAWSGAGKRRQYIPVTIEVTEDPVTGAYSVYASPAAAGGSGSHLVASLAGCETLAVVEAGRGRVEAGDPVEVFVKL